MEADLAVTAASLDLASTDDLAVSPVSLALDTRSLKLLDKLPNVAPVEQGAVRLPLFELGGQIDVFAEPGEHLRVLVNRY